MAEKEKKKNLLDDLLDGDIKSIDPTKIGGLDGISSVGKPEEEAVEWTKSRGKKKD